nr:hypothetical protein [Nanoarchaeum sp.]
MSKEDGAKIIVILIGIFVIGWALIQLAQYLFIIGLLFLLITILTLIFKDTDTVENMSITIWDTDVPATVISAVLMLICFIIGLIAYGLGTALVLSPLGQAGGQIVDAQNQVQESLEDAKQQLVNDVCKMDPNQCNTIKSSIALVNTAQRLESLASKYKQYSDVYDKMQKQVKN